MQLYHSVSLSLSKFTMRGQAATNHTLTSRHTKVKTLPLYSVGKQAAVQYIVIVDDVVLTTGVLWDIRVSMGGVTTLLKAAREKHLKQAK